tara:strand:- start:1277 stop:1489 length:213 start_codon:yes stop_codon:yes gene_type:complete
MARKYDIPKTFEIDSDTADRIAMHSLKEHYNYTVDDLDNFVLHAIGHPEDYDRNVKLKHALEIVLDYYGK